MKLSFEQIKSITFGTTDLWQEDDGIHFRRCTQAQIDSWYASRENLGDGSTRTTGICFDFITDSPWFTLIFAGSNKLDILVDGILYWCHSATSPDLHLTLPEGEHRVTVVFPSHGNDRPFLQTLELADGASLCPHTYDRKILFLGDSITQGWCSSRDSLSWAWQTALAMNAQMLNQGIGGSWAKPEAFPLDVDFDPDTVIVSYGTNDWSIRPSLEALKEAHDKYYDLVCEKYAGKKLVGISPVYRFGTEAGRKMGSFLECCEVVKQSIRDHGMILVDGFTLIPHQEMFFADGLHPLDNGYTTFAQHLVNYL